MRLFFAICALLLFVASAHAQSYGPPTYSVGDTWKRNVNGSEVRDLKVVKVEDGGTWFTGGRGDCPSCLSFVDKNLTLMRITTADGKDADLMSMRFVPLGGDWKFFDFPLEVNKAWRISAQAYFRGSPQRYEVDCKVVSYEDVKTPSGSFKAYRIRQDWTYKNPMAGTYDVNWFAELWFAPDVKSIVKLKSSGRNAEQFELMSYSLK